MTCSRSSGIRHSISFCITGAVLASAQDRLSECGGVDAGGLQRCVRKEGVSSSLRSSSEEASSGI